LNALQTAPRATTRQNSRFLRLIYNKNVRFDTINSSEYITDRLVICDNPARRASKFRVRSLVSLLQRMSYAVRKSLCFVFGGVGQPAAGRVLKT
jgi:hypothetical protein